MWSWGLEGHGQPNTQDSRANPCWTREGTCCPQPSAQWTPLILHLGSLLFCSEPSLSPDTCSDTSGMLRSGAD